MSRSTHFRLATAVAVLTFLLLFLVAFPAMAGPADPESPAAGIISLERNPSPPYSIPRGGQEFFTWTVTFESHPVSVTFQINDPNGAQVDWATFPGTTGLVGTRTYTAPLNPVEGIYWARLRYYSVEAGFEAEAAVTFFVADRGNLHIFVFYDDNANGIQDPGRRPGRQPVDHDPESLRTELRSIHRARRLDPLGWYPARPLYRHPDAATRLRSHAADHGCDRGGDPRDELSHLHVAPDSQLHR